MDLELNFQLILTLLLGIFTCKSFGQLFCSDMTDCSTTINQTADVVTCCLRSDSIAYATGSSGEGCVSCYVYGWVQNVSPDLTSAEPQVDTMAAEGEEVILTLYFTKNDPVNGNLLIFNIAPSGSAALNEDYTVDPMTEIRLRSDPIAITVTLLRDGVVGEGPEDIILTLMQDSRTQPNDNQLLIYDTIRIVLQDNDIQTGFGEMNLTVSESSNVQMACLETVGTPADSIIINVSVIPGTAGTDDFNLITSQLLISSTTLTPCVSFQALADGLGLEGDETLTLSLSGPENALFGQDTLEITILDIDEIVFGFSEEDFAGDESAGVINVTISKSASTAREISLTVTPTEYSDSFGLSPNPPFNPNSPNIATPGDDYVIAPVTVIFPPGDGANILVQLPIIDDVIAEEREQVFVGVLSFAGDSNGATLGRNATKLIITDDDEETIGFEILDNIVKESDQDFNYSLAIVKSILSEQTYSVGLRGTSVSAEPEDYFVPTTPFIFPPDQQTLNVTVTIRGDERIELEEMFEVTLRSVGDVGFLVNLTTRTTTVLIEDDDGVLVGFEQAEYQTSEGSVELCFNTSGIIPKPFTVNLTTSDITAIDGLDYIGVSRLFTLTNDTPFGCVVIDILLDDLVEMEESFLAEISSADPFVTFVVPAATVVIAQEIVPDVNECNTPYHGCEQTCVNILGSYYCDCRDRYSLDSNGKTCSISCGGKLSNTSGSFQTPGWPYSYPQEDFICEWTINVAYQRNITFEFDSSAYGINGRPPCPRDHIEFFNGDTNQSLGRFCFLGAPQPITVSTGAVQIVFEGQWSPYRPTSRKGVRVFYTVHP